SDFVSALMSAFRREFQRKLAEFPSLGPDGNAAFALLDNAEADGQAQAHALAHVLGGKERIENFVQVLGGDAAAIIAQGQNTLAVVEMPLDPNGWFFVLERFALQRVE